MLVEGTNGSVEVFEDHIVIRRKGFANVLTQGFQGDKSIPLASITAIQMRPAGAMMAGMIQFTLLGGREYKGGMLEATKDENAVLFDKGQEPHFSVLRETIQRAMSRRHSAIPVAIASTADELTKLSQLVEKGFLTREEFDEKKRLILSQPNTMSTPVDSSTAALRDIRAQVNTAREAEPSQPPYPAPRRYHPVAVGCFVISLIFIAAIFVLAEFVRATG